MANFLWPQISCDPKLIVSSFPAAHLALLHAASHLKSELKLQGKKYCQKEEKMYEMPSDVNVKSKDYMIMLWLAVKMFLLW